MSTAAPASGTPAAAKKKKSKMAPKSETSAGNPIHRRLKFHEKKMLKQHDFMQYPQDLWHEPFCISKFHLTDREDYRRYLRLVGLIRGLMSHLRFLPSDSKIRIQITDQLVSKLYDMGLLAERLGLAEVDKVGVEAFCKRRLPTVMLKLKMAPNCKIGSDFINHGHVRVGATQVRDPAFLVPRTLDDHITWMDGSKIKGHVMAFNNSKDDFDANA
jgi:U3 small nucleolar ribonucleoprotein protein IMP3